MLYNRSINQEHSQEKCFHDSKWWENTYNFWNHSFSVISCVLSNGRWNKCEFNQISFKLPAVEIFASVNYLLSFLFLSQTKSQLTFFQNGLFDQASFFMGNENYSFHEVYRDFRLHLRYILIDWYFNWIPFTYSIMKENLTVTSHKLNRLKKEDKTIV